MVPIVHEIPLIATVHHVRVRKPSDAAPVVKDKSEANLETDRIHSVPDKTGAKKRDAMKRMRRHSSPSKYTPVALARQSSPITSLVGAAMPDAYHRHSSPSPCTAMEGKSVEVRLCAMEGKLSIMDSKLSSMDSRLSPMESKLNCLIKLLSSTYNTTGVHLDKDDDQCFDEVGGEEVGVGDAHRTLSDEVARQFTHFLDTSPGDQTVELFWITVEKDYFRDM
ncbi:hypothetical protein FNV43_RR10276 [Rhamnella rubrinervis]|uniref:Uncharacterized protein n=1 Tax=Rhamnella rubrinervis TaxID=2594499 RepID=A0A8K0HBK1_9ROSA|nr:hypothetical protein FNV43_RR10276 [Rhamnella rubrinervis]